MRILPNEGTFSTGLPYLAYGTGRPLVYLCDFMMTHTVPPPGGQRRMVERMVLPFVTAGYHVHWTNRRPGLPAGTTIADVATDHAKAVQDAFDGPVPVVGHGTGGSVGLQMAIDHPAAVSRLVVAGTAHTLGPRAREFRRHLREHAARGRSAMHKAAPAITGNRVLQALLVPPLWLSGRLNPPPADRSDMEAMLDAEDRFDVRHRLSEVTVPTLVAWGGRDRLFTDELFRATADGIPGARRAVYPAAGHNMVTRPDFLRDAIGFVGDA